MNIPSFSLKSLPVLALSFSFLPSLRADQTWVGTDPGGALWSTGANWTSAVPGTGDVAIFDSTSAGLATTLGADQSVAGLKVMNPTGAVSVAATNILTLGGSGVDMSAATQNLTMNNAVVLGANQTWDIASGRTLTYAAALSGSGNVIKSGTGITALNIAGTRTGSTSVTGGQLQLTAPGNSSVLIGTGTLSLSGGATVRFAATGGGVVNTALDVGTGGGFISYRGNSSFTPTSISGSGTLTLQAVASGAGGVVVTPTSFQNWNGSLVVTAGSAASTLRLASAYVTNSAVNMSLQLGPLVNMTRQNGTNGTGIADIGTLIGAASSTLGGSAAGGGTFIYKIGARNEDSTMAGAIVDGGTKTGITKTGTATLTLSNTNPYTGVTTVENGVLLVNGALAANGTGATSTVTVATGGTLGGTGTIAGIVNNNGTIAPGETTGTLTLSNNLVMTTNVLANLSYDLKGTDTTVGAGVNDLLTGIINLTLDGTLNVNAVTPFTGISSGTWRLINYSGSLTDNGLILGSMPATDPGSSFSLDTATPGQVNLVLTSVPEVSAAILSGLSFVALFGHRRRNTGATLRN